MSEALYSAFEEIYNELNEAQKQFNQIEVIQQDLKANVRQFSSKTTAIIDEMGSIQNRFQEVFVMDIPQEVNLLIQKCTQMLECNQRYDQIINTETETAELEHYSRKEVFDALKRVIDAIEAASRELGA